MRDEERGVGFESGASAAAVLVDLGVFLGAASAAEKCDQYQARDEG